MASHYIAFELDSTGSVWTHSWTGNYGISLNNTTASCTDFMTGWILGTFSANGNDFSEWGFNRTPLNNGFFVVRLSATAEGKSDLNYVQQFALETCNRSGLEGGRDFGSSYDSPDDMFDSDETTGMKSNHPRYGDNAAVLEQYTLLSMSASLMSDNNATRTDKLANSINFTAEEIPITLSYVDGSANSTEYLSSAPFHFDFDTGYYRDAGEGTELVAPPSAMSYTTGLDKNRFTKHYEPLVQSLDSITFESGFVKPNAKTMAQRKTDITGKETEVLELLLKKAGLDTYDEIISKIK